MSNLVLLSSAVSPFPLSLPLPLQLQALGDLLAGPSLFVVLLSIAFLAFPCYYLFRTLQERNAFDRFT